MKILPTATFTCLLLNILSGGRAWSAEAGVPPPASVPSSRAVVVSVGAGPATAGGGASEVQSFSSLDPVQPNEDLIPPGTVSLADADVAAAFALYERISGRSVIPGAHLPAARLNYQLKLALSRREVLQALDTLLAQQGITMIVMGTKFVKAVNEAEASREAPPESSLSPQLLPDSSTYVQCVIRLRNRAVNDAVPILQPLTHMPNSLITMPSSNSFIVRDYSANVRRIANVVQQFDVPDNGETFVEPERRPRRPRPVPGPNGPGGPGRPATPE